MRQVWTHAATAIAAALLGVAGGARTVGDGAKPPRNPDPVASVPDAQKPLTFAQALEKAKADNLPLVVGVQVAPPKGAWVSCRVESWSLESIKAGWTNTPQIVFFRDGRPGGIMAPTATSADVAKALSPPAAPQQVYSLPLSVRQSGDVCIGGKCSKGR